MLVAKDARGRGLADELVRTALEVIGDREVRLDAQTGLRDWYASYGFEVTGPAFDEDGVFHVPMARPRASRGCPSRRKRWRFSTSRHVEQSALRSLMGAEPVPGRPLPVVDVLDRLDALVPCDKLMVGYSDFTGLVTAGFSSPRRGTVGGR